MRHSVKVILWLVMVLCSGLALSTVAQPVPAAGTPSIRAHQTLQRVLSRPEFITYTTQKGGGWKSSKFSRWLGRVWEPVKKFVNKIGKGLASFFRAIGKFFSRLFSRIARLFPQGNGSHGSRFPALGAQLKYILYVVLGCALLFLIGLIVSKIFSAYRSKPLADDLEAVAADPTTRRKQEPTFWERSLQDAEALWAQGNQREALRLLQRACLVLLDARGILRYDDARANGEVLRELRRQGRATTVQSLRPVVRSFDRSWYGLLLLQEEEFHNALESSRHFRDTVVGEA